jgi:hypothetical protein
MPQTETTMVAAASLPRRDAFDTILSSAGSALANAFLVSILGGVAFSVAGDFAGGMIPSLPPGFAASSTHAAAQHDGANSVRSPAFGILFTLFFLHSIWVGFRFPGTASNHRALRLIARLRENWFSLIITNAISAWVAAVILSAIPNFSLTHIFWQWVWAAVTPSLTSICHHLFGASNTSSWAEWYSWYQTNNHRLYFWILYLAGACDDLGLPNFKTLARFAWRRYRQRQALASTLLAPAKTSNAP